jgi:tetratricopeptide (TPR) repeat protein
MKFQYRMGTPSFPAEAAASMTIVQPLPVAAVMSISAGRTDAGRRPRLRAAALAAAGVFAVMGCASVAPAPPPAWDVQPAMSVQHSMAAGQGYYLMGRYFDGMRAWARAADAYRKAVVADARHVEARNALGVALAQQGLHAEAEAVLREALALDPGRAHVRSNLGYLLMLGGRAGESVAELQAAVDLDAGDEIARGNLRDALALSERAHAAAVAEQRGDAAPELQAETRPVDAPPASDAVAAPAVQAPAEPVAVPVAVAASAPAESEAAAAPAAAASAVDAPVASASAPVPPAAASHRSPVLELSNGNGVTGMAARLGAWLRQQGLRTDRLTNQRPYDQPRTVVQYRSGFAEAAQRVAGLLPEPAHAEAAPTPDLQADVRVVLGHDWARAAGCPASGACAPAALSVAAAAPPR